MRVMSGTYLSVLAERNSAGREACPTSDASLNFEVVSIQKRKR